jgi:hypothetical protein
MKTRRRSSRASNSSDRAVKETWPLHESPTSSFVEKVILGVDTNQKGVQGRAEELLDVQDHQKKARIPGEAEYLLQQCQNANDENQI